MKPCRVQRAGCSVGNGALRFVAASNGLGQAQAEIARVFVILPRDQASGITEESQLYKTVRAVATVDYYLD